VALALVVFGAIECPPVKCSLERVADMPERSRSDPDSGSRSCSAPSDVLFASRKEPNTISSLNRDSSGIFATPSKERFTKLVKGLK